MRALWAGGVRHFDCASASEVALVRTMFADAHIAFMHSFNQALRESGELVSAEGLADPKEAKRVRAGKNREPITDGVFAETKEYLAGYWIIDVDSPEQAYKIAARASAAPGPGGSALNMPIEVRQVMSGPPDDLL